MSGKKRGRGRPNKYTETAPPKARRGRPKTKISKDNQTDECRCKKRKCPQCQKCVACRCKCDSEAGQKRSNQGNAKKRRKTSLQTSFSTVSPQETDKMHHRTNPKRAASKTSYVERMLSPETRDKSLKSRTPETIATNAIMNKLKPSTPQITVLASKFLEQTVDETTFNSILGDAGTDRSKPSEMASLKKSKGSQIKTFGDVLMAFDLHDDDNLPKQIGSVTSRGDNVNFETNSPKEFKRLVGVCQSITGKIAGLAHPANPNAIIEYSQNKHKSSMSTAGKKLQQLYQKSSQRSIERRTIGATIRQIPRSVVDISLPSKSTQQRKNDLQSILDNGKVERKVFFRQRVGDDIIHEAVAFILSSDNAQSLSWGTRTLKFGKQESIDLPKIVRRMPLAQLWTEYQIRRNLNGTLVLKHLGRSSFLELASAITYSGQKSITCVDYVEGNLCNDPTERMQTIIERYFSGNMKADLTNKLELARNFLKVQFDKHLCKNDADGFHSIAHALGKHHNEDFYCRSDDCKVCEDGIENRGNADLFANGKHVMYIGSTSLSPVEVQIISKVNEGDNVDAYMVKKCLNAVLEGDEFKLYRHQLQIIPDVRVECNACKFPFWFCDHLANHVKNKATEAKEKAKEANAETPVREASSANKTSDNGNDNDAITNGSNRNVLCDDSSDSNSQELSQRESASVEVHPLHEEAEESLCDGTRQSPRLETRANINDNDNSENDEQEEMNFPLHYEEAIDAINDSREKFLFYMRHRVRVRCQRTFCEDLEKELQKECERTKANSRCFIVIDWKMKFEPHSARETMPENYGKRGLPWHGIAIAYYEWDEDSQQAVKKVLYIDQIVEGCSKQDCLSVTAVIEAMIGAILVNIPNCKSGIICSDNAGCYTSKFLVAAIVILNAKYKGKFFLEKLVHSETQDGKGAVDRHFAIAMLHIRKFMNTSRTNRIARINTPRGLAYALQWNNGVRNSIVQLMQIDRDLMDWFGNRFKKISNQIKKYYSRASDVRFSEPNIIDYDILKDWNDSTWCVSELESDSTHVPLKGLQSVIAVSAHPLIGNTINFRIDFDSNKVEPDENGKDEYLRNLGMLKDDKRYDSEEDEDYVDDSESWKGEDLYEMPSDNDDDFSFGDSDDENDDLDTDETIETQIEVANDELLSSNNVPECRRYSEPTQDELKKGEMVTGIDIMKTSYLARKNQMTRNKKKKVTNEVAITEGEIEKERSVKAIGVRYAAQYIKDEKIFTDAYDNDIEQYGLCKDFQLRPTEMPFSGFARRDNGGGDMFGARYIGPFKDRIKLLVQKGNEDKGNKLSPAQVLEIFSRENRDSFLLPTTYEIQCYINQILQEKNKGSSDDTGQEDDGEREDNENKLDKHIKVWLRERLYGDINAKPELLYNEIVRQFPSMATADKTSMKKQISSVKAVMKNDAWKRIT